MDDEFLFAGYQVRVSVGSKLICTIADNINPLYVPTRESIKPEFHSIMEMCEIPFLITKKSYLLKLIDLAQKDLVKAENLLIFRCAILKNDSRNSSCEFYDKTGNLLTKSFGYLDEIIEPKIEYKRYGYDVIDPAIGGGFDSAIHTYNLSPVSLNEYGILEEINVAIGLRDFVKIELPEHGPFGVWSISLVKL